MRGNSVLISSLSLLFLLSVGLIIKGYLNYKNRAYVNVNNIEDSKEEVNSEIETPDIGEYFDKGFSGESSGGKYGSDPFRDICAEADAPKGSIIYYSNIVCYK